MNKINPKNVKKAIKNISGGKKVPMVKKFEPTPSALKQGDEGFDYLDYYRSKFGVR